MITIRRTLRVALMLLPFIAICLSVSLWDRVYPLILGLPFNMFWLVSCIPFTTLCLWALYRLSFPDQRAERKPDTA